MKRIKGLRHQYPDKGTPPLVANLQHRKPATRFRDSAIDDRFVALISFYLGHHDSHGYAKYLGTLLSCTGSKICKYEVYEPGGGKKPLSTVTLEGCDTWYADIKPFIIQKGIDYKELLLILAPYYFLIVQYWRPKFEWINGSHPERGSQQISSKWKPHNLCWGDHLRRWPPQVELWTHDDWKPTLRVKKSSKSLPFRHLDTRTSARRTLQGGSMKTLCSNAEKEQNDLHFRSDT